MFVEKSGLGPQETADVTVSRSGTVHVHSGGTSLGQGIGGALFEEFGYDEAGQPQAITFIEYRLPTAAEIPPVDVLLSQDSPSPGNPLGVMGAGEGGINAVGATVANAVRDALGLADGVGRLPLTPARVCALAALAQSTGGPVTGGRA